MSNPSRDDLSFGQILDVASTQVKESGLVGQGKFKKALSHDINGLNKKIAKGLVSNFRSANDNIVIPADTISLIGKPFSTLYVSCETDIFPTDTGVDLTVLSPGNEYETEMHSGTLCMGQLSSYSDMSLRTKVIYETTLLCKQYAYKCDVNDVNANKDLEEQFSNDLIQYMQFCQDNGIDWDGVVRDVSTELQTETSDYLTSLNKLFPDDFAARIDGDRAIAVRANRLIVSNGSDVYIDEIAPALADNLTMDDMENYASNVSLDDFDGDGGLAKWTKKAVFIVTTFATNIAKRIRNYWDDKSIIHNTGKSIVGVADNLSQEVDNIDALQQYDIQPARDAKNKEYTDAILHGQHAAANAVKSSGAVIKQSAIDTQTAISAGQLATDALKNGASAAGAQVKGIMTDAYNQATENIDVSGVKDAATGVSHVVQETKDDFNYGVEQTRNAVNGIDTSGLTDLKNGLSHVVQETKDGFNYGVEQMTKKREVQAESIAPVEQSSIENDGNEYDAP